MSVLFICVFMSVTWQTGCQECHQSSNYLREHCLAILSQAAAISSQSHVPQLSGPFSSPLSEKVQGRPGRHTLCRGDTKLGSFSGREERN